jgi:outer membrane protein
MMRRAVLERRVRQGRDIALFHRCFRPALVCAALLGAAGAHAQTDDDRGFRAGDFLIRVRAIGVIPEDTSSSISLIGGNVNVTATPAPEVDLSYFLTDHVAAELIAARTRHEISASGTALGRVDVGSTYILPPTLTLQYHFVPRGLIDPYLGAGLNVSFWYDTSPAGGAVTKVGLNTVAGPAVQAGFNVKMGHGLFANFDVKQIFIDPEARIDGGAIVARTHLDPTVVGAGIGLRF